MDVRFMKSAHFLLLFVGVCFQTLCGNAQIRRLSGDEADNVFKGSTVVEYDERSTAPIMILLGEQSNAQLSEFKMDLGYTLGLRVGYALMEFNVIKDNLGFTHHHLQEYYKQLRIIGGEYVIHEKNKRVFKANGFYVTGLDLEVTPKLTPSKALELGLKFSGASGYKWEIPEEEAKLRRSRKDSSATWHPVPELVIVSKNLDLKKPSWVLAYRLDISPAEPGQRCIYYVDANTGELVGKEPWTKNSRAK